MKDMHNPQIYEEASEWFVHMREGDEASGVQGEFMQWLRRSPEHVSAYLDIAAVWMEAKNVAVDANLDLAARIALARADQGVAELAPRAPSSMTQLKRAGLDRRGVFALVTSVLVLIAGLAAAWWRFESGTYATGLGEQRSIALLDGSTIDLNSDSRVRIRLGEKQRSVELLRGQALFHVAKDASRPFIVHADNTAVRAIGTVFDVYRKGAGTVVTVVEGRVSVDPRSRPSTHADTVEGSRPLEPLPARQAGAGCTVRMGEGRCASEVLLSAGEQVMVGGKVAAETKAVNVAAATAWTRRELIFEFTPLAEAAAEFNRYNERQLIVEGQALRAFKISAVFRSTNSRALVLYLQNMLGVQVEEGADTVVIRQESKS